MGNSQSQPTKSTPLGCLLQNLKTLGFQGEIRPTWLTYHSNTAWPQSRLDIRFQWPENGTLHSSTLWDLYNFSRRNGKWSEIPYVQAFFAVCSRPSLCESCSTSQILLAYSGPHPSKIMSPGSLFRLFFFFLQPFRPQLTPSRSQFPCSRSRSSFTTSTLRPLLPPSCSRAGHLRAQPLSPASSETSAPSSTPRVPRLYPDLPRSPTHTLTRFQTTLKQETSPQDPTPFPDPLSLYRK